MARPRAVSKGGAGYTPKSGVFAGQHFQSYYAYRDARAVRGGYENYSEQRAHRQATAEELGHPLRYSRKFKYDPRGEKLLHEAWRQGKRIGRAKTKSAKDAERRRMDETLLELQMERPGFSVTEDFWYH